jgi:hypothetical protein
MNAIGPGDFVECVDAEPEAHCPFRSIGLSRGHVYRVERVLVAHETEVLVLAEVLHPHNEWGAYRADRFRPIYRPKRSLIEGLKRPVREPA